MQKKPSNVRNALFAACVSVVLVSSLGNYILFQHDSEGEERRSYLEGRIYQSLPEWSLEGYLSREYQDRFEQFAADSIPYRDDVMLGNAWLQRLGITSANSVFGFEAYPTFFGSGYLECQRFDAIVEYPSSKRVATKQLLGECIDAVGIAMGKHPNCRWVFALVERSRNSASNPASTLVSQHADYVYYRTEFLENLPTGCRYVDLEEDGVEEYYSNYFHTDHHAQISGALQAYRKVITSFGREPLDLGELRCVFSGPFYGSEARSGLSTEHADSLYDIVQPKAAFKVEVDGKEVPIDWLNRGYANSSDYEPKERFANLYAEWFHADAGEIHIQNTKGKGSLLIVGDSFTNNIDYLFAYSYRDVYILDARHYDGVLDKFIKRHQVDDVLLLMASNTLVNSSTIRFLRG